MSPDSIMWLFLHHFPGQWGRDVSELKNREYYRQRERIEREAAKAAKSAAARRAHQEMAQTYALRCALVDITRR